MECPKCESKAMVADIRRYRKKAGEPLYEIRTYVCSNYACLHAFTYRNSYLDEAGRIDAKRWLDSYHRRNEEKDTAQLSLQEQLNQED